MKERTKWVAAGVLIVSGLALITRNLLHDPDRGFRKEPRQKQLVTFEQVPAPSRRRSERRAVVRPSKSSKRSESRARPSTSWK